MDQKKLILASASPRRCDILRAAGLDFEITVSRAKELSPDKKDVYTVVCENAAAKAKEVFFRLGCREDAVVLGADTLVCIHGKALGKPKDEDDAKKMLSELSGREHSVITGVSLVDSEGEMTDFCETAVKFRHLSSEEIDAYVATGEPMDKAGAYGIQEKGCLLVEEIRGDFFNVVGLPVSKVFGMLKEKNGSKKTT